MRDEEEILNDSVGAVSFSPLIAAALIPALQRRESGDLACLLF
jgi:hypothetical protein